MDGLLYLVVSAVCSLTLTSIKHNEEPLRHPVATRVFAGLLWPLVAVAVAVGIVVAVLKTDEPISGGFTTTDPE